MPFPFSWPTSAISVVAYYGNAGEDYPCDRHSAEHFDAAMTLWGQTDMFRLFPELDATGKQTHRLTMTWLGAAHSFHTKMHMERVTAESLQKSVEDIRKELPKLNLGTAFEPVQQLQEKMFSLWFKEPPREVQQDLNSSTETLRGMRARGEKFPAALVPLFLKVNEYSRAPGRADCQAMQLNVDGTIP